LLREGHGAADAARAGTKPNPSARNSAAWEGKKKSAGSDVKAKRRDVGSTTDALRPRRGAAFFALRRIPGDGA